MISPNEYRKMHKDKGLNELLLIKEELESKIEKLSKEENNQPIFSAETRLSISTQYLDEIKKLIVEKENTINNISHRESFKLSQLKYTKYHWMSGENVNGCPITTSIEIKPEMLGNNDLRVLRNNYFSDDEIQWYSHWELEYNYYFKISGTFERT